VEDEGKGGRREVEDEGKGGRRGVEDEGKGGRRGVEDEGKGGRRGGTYCGYAVVMQGVRVCHASPNSGRICLRR
jgi:hypothetical protein